MTRDEWISRFAARMVARGSWMDEANARSVAEGGADATEQANNLDPGDWESPEMVADEHLLSDGDIEEHDTDALTPFSTDGLDWFVANGFGQVASGPFGSAREAQGWITNNSGVETQTQSSFGFDANEYLADSLSDLRVLVLMLANRHRQLAAVNADTLTDADMNRLGARLDGLVEQGEQGRPALLGLMHQAYDGEIVSIRSSLAELKANH